MQVKLSFICSFPFLEFVAVQKLAPLRGYEPYPPEILYQSQAFLHFSNDGRELRCVSYEY
jgi:hypothetical protein